MSYDIFFVRRDPGQTFEDALDGVEDSYESGDLGPLSDDELDQWDSLLPRAREILGPQAEVTQATDATRELTDPVTGIGLTFFQGEFELHVPESRAGGSDDLDLMGTVYQLARAVERVTGLEGYDPQLGEPVSDASEESPTRRRWPDEPPPEDDDDQGPVAPPSASPAGALPREPFAAEPARSAPTRRWWQLWKP